MILLVVVLIIAVILAIAIGAAASSGTQQLPPGPPEPPPLGPPRTPHFHKRPSPPRGKHFQKRVPPLPPATRDMKRKQNQGQGGITPKEVRIDFNLPCRVTGVIMLKCGCQICRDLRKKFDV
jgi:hypothetical protein